jgi:hypothetical protein
MAPGVGTELGEEAARRLAQLGTCTIERGLSEAELGRIEQEYHLEFADDHRAFLAAGLPVAGPPREPLSSVRAVPDPWPDWRDGDPERLRAMLRWPIDGVLFDVSHNAFWHDSWGIRPADPDDALTVARTHLVREPTMVPVYGHRFLPAGHGTYGHPVLSMYQTDVICYGADLLDYVHQEFDSPRPGRRGEDVMQRVTVGFWRELL